MSPLALKYFLLEPEKIWDPELEIEPISGFGYFQMEDFQFRNAVRIKLRHVEHFFFLV